MCPAQVPCVHEKEVLRIQIRRNVVGRVQPVNRFVITFLGQADISDIRESRGFIKRLSELAGERKAPLGEAKRLIVLPSLHREIPVHIEDVNAHGPIHE